MVRASFSRRRLAFGSSLALSPFALEMKIEEIPSNPIDNEFGFQHSPAGAFHTIEIGEGQIVVDADLREGDSGQDGQMPFLLFGGSGHPCGMMKGSTGGDAQILPKLIEKGTVSDFLNHQNVRSDQVDQGTQSPLFLCGFGVIGLPLPRTIRSITR